MMFCLIGGNCLNHYVQLMLCLIGGKFLNNYVYSCRQ